MTDIEKNKLKEEYEHLKDIYKRTEEALKKLPSDSHEAYELRGSLSILGLKISGIRRSLIDQKFEKFYPTSILERFVLGEETKKGRR